MTAVGFRRCYSLTVPIAMTDRPHHRFRKHLREWFRLLWESGLITEQEFKAAYENELADELEERPDAE